MSAQLTKLRDLFDYPILIGDAHGMVISARMEGMKAPLRQQLQELDHLAFQTDPFDPQTTKRHFVIGATDYNLSCLASPLIQSVMQEAPNAKLIFVPYPIDDAEKALENRMDFAIGSERMTPKHLPASSLMEDGFTLVMRKGHPLDKEPISLDAFCNASFILTSPNIGGLTGIVDELLAEKGMQRHVMASAPNFLLTLQMVRESDALAVVPALIAHSMKQGLALQSPL